MSRDFWGLEQFQYQEISTDIQVGELAIINNGPFEGSEGKILEINSTKGSAKIRVNLLGRDTPVEVEFASITRIK